MRNLLRFLVLLPALLILDNVSSPGETLDTQTRDADNKLSNWCLSHFPDIGMNATPSERPIGKLPPFDMKDAIAPPNLIKETAIVGGLPKPLKGYQGLWISPVRQKSSLYYAAFVERLTPTEMTIALLVKPPEDRELNSTEGLRQNMKWAGTGFVSENTNLLGIRDVTFTAQVSQFGDTMLLGWANDREAYLLGCLISYKHY